MAEHASEKGGKEVRFLPKAHALVAQRKERDASIVRVAGSSPAEGTNNNENESELFTLVLFGFDFVVILKVHQVIHLIFNNVGNFPFPY